MARDGPQRNGGGYYTIITYCPIFSVAISYLCGLTSPCSSVTEDRLRIAVMCMQLSIADLCAVDRMVDRRVFHGRHLECYMYFSTATVTLMSILFMVQTYRLSPSTQAWWPRFI